MFDVWRSKLDVRGDAARSKSPADAKAKAGKLKVRRETQDEEKSIYDLPSLTPDP